MVSFKTIVVAVTAATLVITTGAMPADKAVASYHHRLSSSMNETCAYSCLSYSHTDFRTSNVNTLANSTVSFDTTAAASSDTPSVLPATLELHPDYVGTSYWDKGLSALFDSHPTPVPSEDVEFANRTSAGEGGITYNTYYPYRGYCKENQVCRFFRITFKCPTCTNPKLWRGCCIMRHKNEQ